MAEANQKKTPMFDWKAGEFVTDIQGRVLTATETDAVEQIVIKSLETERGQDLIYADVDNPENGYMYGNEAAAVMTSADLPEEVRIEELKRAIKEALVFHEWINDVQDIELIRRTPETPTITLSDGTIKEIGVDEVYASFTVYHIFGTTSLKGVKV
ncbi:DUF2634 domain-containing protein [Bacillota bacterium Lsc_1132]